MRYECKFCALRTCYADAPMHPTHCLGNANCCDWVPIDKVIPSKWHYVGAVYQNKDGDVHVQTMKDEGGQE